MEVFRIILTCSPFSFIPSSLFLFLQVWHREPWTISPFLYLALIGIFWALAFYYYFNIVAQWEVIMINYLRLNYDIDKAMFTPHDILLFSLLSISFPLPCASILQLFLGRRIKTVYFLIFMIIMTYGTSCLPMLSSSHS